MPKDQEAMTETGWLAALSSSRDGGFKPRKGIVQGQLWKPIDPLTARAQRHQSGPDTINPLLDAPDHDETVDAAIGTI